MTVIHEPPASIGKFLKITALRPGDVILSYGGGKISKLIATATKGPFSHAAIVRNYMQRVEALDDGVGLTNHRLDRVEWHGSDCTLLMKISEAPTVVLRHREAVTDNPTEAERFDRELYRLQGLPYADWAKFLNALPDDHFARPIADRIQPSDKAMEVLEGRFCSECVAETYAAMGWRLPGIKLDRVSPNDLWRLRHPDGPLKVMDDLIVDADDAAAKAGDAKGEAIVTELTTTFPPSRFKLEEMKRFKLGMATVASRRRTVGPIAESMILQQIELRIGTEAEYEIPLLEAQLEKLRETLKRGDKSDHALGLD
jgi:hypothetical protein